MSNKLENLFEEFLETPEKKKLTTVPRTTKILREGEAIIIPEPISYRAASKALSIMADQDEEEIERVETYTCHPNDGYVAVTRAIEDSFGFATARAIDMGFFGKQKPQTKRIKTGLGISEYVEAFSDGDIGIPNLPDVAINLFGNEDEMQFAVRVTAKKKHSRAVNALLDEVGRRIRDESIYKGKAFDSKFNFLDLSGAHEANLVLPQSTEVQIQANLFAPLKHKAKLRDIGTEFGRSILLEGEYGCGKTLAAFVAGNLAVKNGVTFIYVRAEDANKLPKYMRYARQYASNGSGAVLFYEDIDLVMGTSDVDRSQEMNLMLNTLDGIDAKSGSAQDVMLVLTSNNAETINEALMRPGRIDAVIHIGPPDANAAAKLIAMYGRHLLSNTFDFEVAGAACEGMTPAFIREIVDRSKLVALSRTGTTTFKLEASDIEVAAQAIAEHKRLATPRKQQHTTGDRLASAMREVVEQVVTPIVGTTVRESGKIGAWVLGSERHRDAFESRYGKATAELRKENPLPIPQD